MIRELFVSFADIEPNDKEQTLVIHIHRMTTPAHDKAINALLQDLNKWNFKHPETGMKIIYKLV